MSELDKITGLPKELFEIDTISKETQKIKIRVERRRMKKLVTSVVGIDSKKEMKEIAKELKKKLACGGTVKGDEIELQGDHKKRVREFLIAIGYKEEQIDA
ncbi:MAG: stress response translation initiation inhibitor YciH [Candidatus Diapherotrites archaeon]|nr:stress response translation initiation inhibitor YciH [Candidatus Diapherotrites archaeon]